MDVVLDLVVTAASLAVVVQYALSLRTHFKSARMPTGTVVISAVVTGTSLIYLALLWLLPQPPAAQVFGLLLEVAGMGLFLAAIQASRAAALKMAFDRENPHGLVKQGPYRYVRHPFYTSYLIFWIGWSVATWSVWAIPPLVLIAIIYVLAARGEEGKFSRTDMASAYADYRRQTGFFWPKFPGADRG